MKPYRVSQLCVPLLIVAMATATTQAAMLHVDFDGPGDVAGQYPPGPWYEEADRDYLRVQSGVGYLGTQGLQVHKPSGHNQWIYYELPTPLSADMGAVSVSFLFKPTGLPSGYNFGNQGAFALGYGSIRYDMGTRRWITFAHYGGTPGVFRGSFIDTRLGGFTANEWYQITYQVHADWQNMTVNVGRADQEPTMTTDYPWNGQDITRIWLSGSDDQNRSIYFDNFTVVPEPTSLALLGLCGLVLLRRRTR